MAKYDGLIIPRSYNDYINKSDPLGVAQALQLTGVMDAAPTAASTKPAKSGGIFAANAVIMASSATLTGVAISAGSVVRVLFTADLTGSDAITGLTLTYNGTAYAVKVGKNGALANFNAYEVESGVFKYLQAYTTLELMFDGTQFIIIGNPVVLSSADYTIYPDGSITYTKSKLDVSNVVTLRNDNSVQVTYRCANNLVIFTIYAKTAVNTSVTLPFNVYADAEGLKTALTLNNSLYGEVFITASEKNRLYIFCNSECSGEFVVFM